MRWNLRYDFQEEVEIKANLEKKRTQLCKGSFWQRMSVRAPLKPVKEHFCHGNIYPVCLHSSKWPLTSNLGHYLQSQYCWVVLNNFLCFDFLNNLLLPSFSHFVFSLRCHQKYMLCLKLLCFSRHYSVCNVFLKIYKKCLLEGNFRCF